jgi:hypothetical protein
VWQDEEDKLGWPFGIRTRATSRWCRAQREGSGAWHVWTLSSPGRPRSRASERLRADLPGGQWRMACVDAQLAWEEQGVGAAQSRPAGKV